MQVRQVVGSEATNVRISNDSAYQGGQPILGLLRVVAATRHNSQRPGNGFVAGIHVDV